MGREKSGLLRGLFITLTVFALLFAGAFLLLDNLDSASREKQTELVYEAVRSALVTCYAVEGQYPPELQYLKENYGLQYDEEKYLVSYDAFASNIMPEVRVMVKGAAGL